MKDTKELISFYVKLLPCDVKTIINETLKAKFPIFDDPYISWLRPQMDNYSKLSWFSAVMTVYKFPTVYLSYKT